MRNKEIAYVVVCNLIVSSLAIGGAMIFPRHQFTIIVLLILSLGFIYSVFTQYRYHQLKKLTVYLRAFSNGNYQLDIRDHREGELSRLKHELHQVMLVLMRQSELLELEKTALANSLSDISHQLKTPLTSLQVMTDLLSTDSLQPQKREEFLWTIKSQLRRIEALVSCLLKIAKLDSNTVAMKKEKILLKDLLHKSCEHLWILLELKEQELHIDGDENAMTEVDVLWSSEALSNIIKNAIEHTKTQETIQVTYESNPIFSAIRIQNPGDTIAKKDLPHIFDRFYKGQNANTDSIGIGLALAKQIVERQNGTIVAQSNMLHTLFEVRFYKQIV